MVHKTKEIKPCPKQKITDCGGKYYFDEAAANRFPDFCAKFIKHTQGQFRGKPFILEPWELEIFRNFFGWLKKSDGLRRFKKLYLEIPKKQGKSSLCAALALYLLAMDGEFSAEVYGGAKDKKQAQLIFREAKRMVKASPALRKLYQINSGTITIPKLEAMYCTVSRETASQHGINASAVIFDELHALKDAELFEVLTMGSGDARQQPVQIAITTAGFDRTSVCWLEHSHALDVIKDESVDERLLAYIYAADEGDDWRDPAVWRKANPNLGITVTEEAMRDACLQAQSQPKYENMFKRLRLNLWTSTSQVWIPAERWNTMAMSEPINMEALRGRKCYMGLDLSSTNDLTAVVLLFPFDDKLILVPKFFCPADNLENREKRDAVAYVSWAKNGYIQATPGDRIDQIAVEAYIDECRKLYSVEQAGYDTWNADMIVAHLTAKGLEMVPVPQGFKLSARNKDFEVMVANGQLRHGGHPVLAWMASNTEAMMDKNENIAIVKAYGQAKALRRIDGIIASIMALDMYRRFGAEDDMPSDPFFI